MFKKVLISLLCILIVVLSVAGFLLIPRHGKVIESAEWQGANSFDMTKIQTLKKENGKDFKILQLTDLQLDVPFKNKDYLKNSIDEMIKENNPDLIVLTGDNVAGVFMHFHIKTVVNIIDSYNIPWAVVFGNHDREFGNNLYYQAKQFNDAKNCLFEVGPSNLEGLGNYVINIEEDGTPVYSLFMIDSNSEIVKKENGETIKYFDYIYPNQIEWYKDNVDGITKAVGHEVPSMSFFHIPVPEYKTALDLAEAGSADAHFISGEKREDPCIPKDNSGFFEVFKSNGGTHMFAGHDHGNNAIVEYQGVVMSYGTKTGDYSGHYDDKMGGTLITINDEVSVEHIIKPLK